MHNLIQSKNIIGFSKKNSLNFLNKNFLLLLTTRKTGSFAPLITPEELKKKSQLRH
jgi:hypothetical protein